MHVGHKPVLFLQLWSSYVNIGHTGKRTQIQVPRSSTAKTLTLNILLNREHKGASYRLTCSPYCRLRVIAFRALTIWALVAAGLSMFSRPMPSSNFKRYGTNSAFRAWNKASTWMNTMKKLYTSYWRCNFTTRILSTDNLFSAFQCKCRFLF